MAIQLFLPADKAGYTTDEIQKLKENIITQFDANRLEDVSNSKILRGDATVSINGTTYAVPAYDLTTQGNATQLLQHKESGALIVAYDNNIKVILPIESKTDTNVLPYRFVAKNGENKMKSEKVVGTTFRFKELGERDYKEFYGEDRDAGNVITRVGQALLMPEPTNQYDPQAVMVLAKMMDGSVFHLGYLSKSGTLRDDIKEPTPARLIISAYSYGGDYNDSYTVEVDN